MFKLARAVPFVALILPASLNAATGDGNLRLGDGSLRGIVADGGPLYSGKVNIAIGQDAMSSRGNQSAVSTAIGQGSQRSVIRGYSNVSVGFRTLEGLVAGLYNTAMGVDALKGLKTGNENSGFGTKAMLVLQDGQQNTGLGGSAFYGLRTGSFNTGAGASAFLNMRTGNFNVGLGYQAGRSVESGRNNTILGSAPGEPEMFDTIILAAGQTERARWDQSGAFLSGVDHRISDERGRLLFSGSTHSGLALTDADAAGKARAVTFWKGVKNVGAIEVSAAGTSYLTISDRRLKTNIKPLVQGWARVAAYRPVEFDWKDNGEHDRGFIADEFAEVNPRAVIGEKNGPTSQMLDSGKAMADVIAALQEAQKRIEKLEAKVAELEARKPPRR